MRLITEVRPGTVHAMNTLGTIKYVPLLIPSFASVERADVAEVEVSWTGLAGGAADSIVVARMRGYAASSGVVFSGSPLAPTAEMWDSGRVIQSSDKAGTANENGGLFAGNDIAAGRAAAQFMRTLGAGAVLDRNVIVGIIHSAGTGFSGGNLIIERVSFYNSQLRA